MNPSDSTSEADLLTNWSRMVSSLRDTAPPIGPTSARSKRRRRRRAPLPNGDNGDCQSRQPLPNGDNGDSKDEPPSPNGDNGDLTGEVPPVVGKKARDSRGRFAKGNPGGPGNPFARRLAALRTVLCSVVTEKDMRELAYQLMAYAKLGDLAAAKLLLAYTVGRPTDAVDPDTLDANELQLWRQSAVVMDDFNKTLASMPAEIGVPLVRIVGLTLGRILAGKMADKLKEEPPRARKDEKMRDTE